MLPKQLFRDDGECFQMIGGMEPFGIESTKPKADNVMSSTAKMSFTKCHQADSVKSTSAVDKHNKPCRDLMTAVNKLTLNNDLIADCSRTYSFPTVTGKHQDLNSISPQTLSELIDGRYKNVINSYRIIDCRYPYEFEGGHIEGAENRYSHASILELLQQPTTEKQILVFHCEFSSERGPKMMRFLRSKDRELNKENYPALNYPEVYLLDDGYKSFFNEKSTYCDPISYKPMIHSEHSSDLRHFRAKSKSWTTGEKRQHARRSIRL
ncbi:STG [Mytilus coruscus]|uniref:M-phase inducer phosphatase n=1 Tax=Mytilus coruscus TaxID=42192 RepID=A0A6J8BBT2_MYTCO|nr:STG [Mytilus coruscus]